MTFGTLPELTIEADCYVIEWAGLKAEFSHLHEVRGAQYGGLNCEVRITTTLPGIPSHLHEARINLSSTSGRETLAKALKRRVADGIPDVVPVEDFVEMACVLVMRKHREGSPVVQLADGEVVPPRFPVGSIAPYRKPAMIYAPAESLKSTFGLSLCLDVTTGDPGLGFAIEGGPVLFCDYETDEDEARFIWSRLCAGRGLSQRAPLFYRRCLQPFWDEAESLRRLIVREGICLVLIDSYFWACGCAPLAQENVGMMFQGIKALDTTVIGLHHTAAAQGDQKRRRPYGLEHFRNASRSSWEIRKARMLGDPAIYLGLYRDKLNISPDEGPFGFKVTFEGKEGPIRIEPHAGVVDDVPELEESKPAPERVRDFLARHGKASAKELGEGLNITVDAVYQNVKRLGALVDKQNEGRNTLYFLRELRRQEDL